MLGFTSLDRDVTIDGVIYYANTAITPTAVTDDMDVNANNLEVSGFIDSNLISDVDLRMGRFNGEVVEAFIGNFTTPAKVKTLVKGTWGGAKKDNLKWQATINTNADKLDTTLTNVISPSCRWTGRLENPRCGVSRYAFSISGTITGGINAREIQTDMVIPKPRLFNWSSGGGYLIATAGNNTGFRIEIDNVLDTGRITTLRFPPYAWQVGDTLTIYPGCDGSFSMCKNDYNNAPKWGGIPDEGNFYPSGTDLRK